MTSTTLDPSLVAAYRSLDFGDRAIRLQYQPAGDVNMAWARAEAWRGSGIAEVVQAVRTLGRVVFGLDVEPVVAPLDHVDDSALVAASSDGEAWRLVATITSTGCCTIEPRRLRLTGQLPIGDGRADLVALVADGGQAVLWGQRTSARLPFRPVRGWAHAGLAEGYGAGLVSCPRT